MKQFKKLYKKNKVAFYVILVLLALVISLPIFVTKLSSLQKLSSKPRASGVNICESDITNGKCKAGCGQGWHVADPSNKSLSCSNGTYCCSRDPFKGSLVYTVATEPRTDVVQYNWATTKQTNITSENNIPENSLNYKMSFSKDYSKAVFLSGTNDGSYYDDNRSIYLYYSDTKKTEKLEFATRFLNSWVNIQGVDIKEREIHPFIWSPDGNKFAFQVSNYDPDSNQPYNLVFIVDLENKSKVNVVNNATDPTWSPNSEWIAYTYETSYIYKIRYDGNENTKLTEGSYPLWSDNIKRIYVIYQNDIITINSNGTIIEQEKYSYDNYDRFDTSNFSFSPDYRYILGSASYQDSGATKIDRTFLIDTKERKMIPLKKPLYYPVWSPDSKFILFADESYALYAENGQYPPNIYELATGLTIMPEGDIELPLTGNGSVSWIGNLVQPTPRPTWHYIPTATPPDTQQSQEYLNISSTDEFESALISHNLLFERDLENVIINRDDAFWMMTANLFPTLKVTKEVLPTPAPDSVTLTTKGTMAKYMDYIFQIPAFQPFKISTKNSKILDNDIVLPIPDGQYVNLHSMSLFKNNPLFVILDKAWTGESDILIGIDALTNKYTVEKANQTSGQDYSFYGKNTEYVVTSNGKDFRIDQFSHF